MEAGGFVRRTVGAVKYVPSFGVLPAFGTFGSLLIGPILAPSLVLGNRRIWAGRGRGGGGDVAGEV